MRADFGNDFATSYAALVNFLATESFHIENVDVTDCQLQRILFRKELPASCSLDDAIAARNLFWATHTVIQDAIVGKPYTFEYICKLHDMLAGRTSKFLRSPEAAGSIRTSPVRIGGTVIPPDEVNAALSDLSSEYEDEEELSLEDITRFHIRFERIHPFVDLNGRIGRLILLHQSLLYNSKAALILNDSKEQYYRAIAEDDTSLMETLITEGIEKVQNIIDIC